MKRSMYRCLWSFAALLFMGCGNRFLDVKPNENQRVPTSLGDFQAILDRSVNYATPMNVRSSHYLGIVGGDEYYIEDQFYNTWPNGVTYTYQKNAYTWEDQVYIGDEGGTVNPTDYDMAYQRILYCNIVLDGISNMIDVDDELKKGQVRGDALFRRALDFYNLAQLYCEVYRQNRLETAYGIPLRTSSSINRHVERGTLGQVYEQILQDLHEAITLLPDLPLVVFRPSKVAAYTLLTRVYLQMEDFDMAMEFAKKALAIKNTLIDYNTVEEVDNYRFPQYGIDNDEVIFTNEIYYNVAVEEVRICIDSNLLSLYEKYDLRKTLYYKTDDMGKTIFWGSYYGSREFFSGFATDELYLTLAECYARLGRIDEANEKMNFFLKNRISKDYFIPISIADQAAIISFILKERRKSLVLRGVRWEDLRRLNKDTAYSTTLRKVVNGKEYLLKPGDKKWVWPLPQEAVLIGGLEQNNR